MKLIIVLSLAALAVAAPQGSSVYYQPTNDVQILRYEVDNTGLGDYRYAYEQSDGTRQEAQGYLKNAGSENEGQAVTGSFSWIAPNGIRYIVKYTADENGYQPEVEEGPGGAPPGAAIASLLG